MTRQELTPKEQATVRNPGTQILSLERRYGDVITNAHLRRLADEGFRIIGATEQTVGDEVHFIITLGKS